MTFEEFQATRQHCDDLAKAIDSAPWGDTTATGLTYLGDPAKGIDGVLYIEETASWPHGNHAKGKYYLLINRSEWVSDDLESLERQLYAFAASEGYFDPHEREKAVCRKWVGRIGLGFHPDTRGKDYSPKMTDEEIREYDADMEALFAGGGDPYDFAVKAMEEQGLV